MLGSDPDRAVCLPFEHLLEQLTLKGFRIGVEHTLRLQVLLDRLGDQCPPSDLKTLLCPLFAANALQQESFYRAFDACYPFLRSEAAAAVAEPGIADHPARSHSRLTRGWLLVIAGAIVIALAALIGIALWTDTPESAVPPAAAPSPARTLPQPERVIPPTTQSPWLAWYSARRSELGWMVIGGPLAAWVVWELYRSRRRSLFIRKSVEKTPPYSWPVRADATPEIYEPSQLASVNRLLHRRYQGESERLDVMATVAASVASFGFPTFRYRRDSQLPEYLFLIDRAGFRDHQSHLHEHLASTLRAQGLYVTTWFFDHDPRVCWSADHGSSVYLEQLARACSGHRLFLFGTADYLLDGVTGRLTEWHQVFDSWSERAILTPEPPSQWGGREVALTSQFVVVPATLDGLKLLAAYFGGSGSRGQESVDDGAAPAPATTADINAVRNYLGPDLFQWLCACAIYPELQWGLTLTLGGLASMPPGLVCEENLTKLLRLEWFRTGSIPDDRRIELIAQLEPRVEREVREAIVRVLEDSSVPPEPMAASAHRFQIAYQRASLAPKDRLARANLKQALDDLSTHEIAREHAYLDVSESKPASALDLVLPQNLRNVFYPAGVPLMPQRALSGFAMVLLVVAAGLGSLRVADRWVFPAEQLLTITKPTGGTIVGPGIECGTDGSRCSTRIKTGEPIELNLRADRDYVFSGFTGDCAPAGRIPMTEPRTCGATFSRIAAPAVAATFRLTIAKPEGGTIVGNGGIYCGTHGSACTADIPSGVPVSLRAEADDGFAWQQFMGDCPSTGEMTMTAAKTCGAAFVRSAGSINAAGPIGAAGPPRPTLPMMDPAKPAPARMVEDEHAKEQIHQLVKNYCAALQTLNPATIRRLYHLDNQREFTRRFSEYKSLTCTVTTPATYDRLDASPAGGAQLRFGLRQVVEMRTGGPSHTVETVVTMVVSRKDFQSPWLVDRLTQEPTTAASKAVSPGTSAPVAPAEKPAIAISPAQGGLVVMPGETDKAYKTRVMAMAKKYDDAVALLADKKYQQALAMFSDIMSEVPGGYRDLLQRRDEARAGMRAEAKTALVGAEAAEKGNHYDAAIDQYRRAHQLDPTIEVDAAILRVTDRKLAVGRQRCEEGLVDFTLGNTASAVLLLQQAVGLLPESEPCYAKAKDALQRLGK